ncbi:MAG: ATP-binding protein [Chlorobium sp.]|nr:ATP-binding protein [Chlorobium sp.]
MESLAEYLADNVGSLMSANNISKYLKSQKVAMPVQTVITYLDALKKSFFVHRAVRSEIHGLKLFEIGEKYYFEDLGLRNVLRRQSGSADAGKLVENAVYLHLIQSGFDVHIGQDDGREIDFVCQSGGRRIYVQAAYVIGDAATAEREFGNLRRIRDNHPKYVVTMDQFIPDSAPEGIRHLRLNDFLLCTAEQLLGGK